jgi:ABC-2 type transport system permease protein
MVIAVNASYPVALFGLVLLFTIISLSGGFLAITIIEEKSGRIMEVILSSISPTTLLIGKIIGVLLFSLTQFICVIAIWIISNISAGTTVVKDLGFSQIFFYIMWIAPAVIAFSFVYGGFGALISRSEDSGALQGPMTILLVGSVYLAVYGLLNPDMAIVRIGMFLPPFNYFVALGQLLYSGQFSRDILASYILALMFSFLAIFVATSTFRSNLLHTQRFNFTSRVRKAARRI